MQRRPGRVTAAVPRAVLRRGRAASEGEIRGHSLREEVSRRVRPPSGRNAVLIITHGQRIHEGLSEIEYPGAGARSCGEHASEITKWSAIRAEGASRDPRQGSVWRQDLRGGGGARSRRRTRRTLRADPDLKRTGTVDGAAPDLQTQPVRALCRARQTWLGPARAGTQLQPPQFDGASGECATPAPSADFQTSTPGGPSCQEVSEPSRRRLLEDRP